MLIAERFSKTRLIRRDGHLAGAFNAMGCACEVLIDTDDEALARDIVRMASDEALRIENKFSRYKRENIVDRINHAAGQPVDVDEETGHLLDFAARGWELSGGLFDITSGVLRKAWTFDGSDRLPDAGEVARLLPFVGWDKVEWKRPAIRLRDGMQIDLGGIGKEYAVDVALRKIRTWWKGAVLVNFGGDIAAAGERRDGLPWTAGIEDASRAEWPAATLHLSNGALATSGDARRFLVKDGRRYGHILDPRTGWPVANPPRSVTVAADTCSEAGFLSTLGILSGGDAEERLKAAGVPFWCQRTTEETS